MERPNILLITADQHNARALGCAGDAVVRTPHFDRLARQSTVFLRAYSPQPRCFPARASIWTGLHAATQGARDGASPGRREALPAGSLTFCRLLRDAGYETALIGKRHLRSEREWDMGLDYQDLAEGKDGLGPDGGTDDYRRWLSSQGHGGDEVATWERADLDAEYTKYHSALPFPLDESLHVDAYVGRQTIRWLSQPKDRPFFLWVSFCSPRHPYDPPGRYCAMYGPDEVVLPARPADELDGKPLAHRVWALRCALERPGPGGFGEPCELVRRVLADPDRCPPSEQIATMLPEDVQRRMTACYCGTVSLVDDQVGQIIDTLRLFGRLDDTAVVFAADHGDHLGEHHMWFDGATMYESLVRVPLLVRLPGAARAGQQCSELVSLCDLAPTFLEWADLADPGTFDGASLQPLVEKPRRAFRDELFVGSRAVVTQEWKYVWNGPDTPELYSLADDPRELANLAGLPEHGAVERELRNALFARFGSPDDDSSPKR